MPCGESYFIAVSGCLLWSGTEGPSVFQGGYDLQSLLRSMEQPAGLERGVIGLLSWSRVASVKV